ncbi:hypothetical protein MLE05_005102 [Klebsiella oxytoca]|nr:hypothetical protein [Klebsiella oxytoca]
MAHVKVKELVAAAYAAAAQLMQDIASRLDVTFVALTEAMDQNTAMAAMIANLSEENRNG